jgi:2-keto-4-pentenoate hydratase
LTPEQIRQAAHILAVARRSGTLLPDLPADLQPQTSRDAYAIQYSIASLFGAIGGWKVGLPKPTEEPRATPIPALYVMPSGGRWPAAAPTRLEVEFAVKIKTSLPKRGSPYAREDVLGAIGSAHIALELLGARFQDRKQVAGLTLLADGQSNGGLVVGAPIPDWTQVDLAKLAMTLRVEGAIEATTSAGPALDPTVDALVWLANHAAEHVGGLKEGQVILTGARIGPTTVPAQRGVEAQTGEARVSVTLG